MVSNPSGSKRSRVRTSIALEFGTPAEKSAFSRRLESVRDLLTPQGSRSIDNYSLMTAMIDYVEQSFPRPVNDVLEESSSTSSFNKDNGMLVRRKMKLL